MQSGAYLEIYLGSKQIWKFAFNPQNLAIFRGKHLLKNIL